MKFKWTKEYLENIVKDCKSQKEVLIKLKIRSAGGNYKTLKKYINIYEISTEHFVKCYEKMIKTKIKKPLSEILIKNSNFNRSYLKKRLYSENLLKPICSICDQDENWKGVKISLIIDHINGIYNDNRIENLRIVCPNCNAGLDTFAGRNLKNRKNNYCECGNIISKKSIKCSTCNGIVRRIVERPTLELLLKDIEVLGYAGTGRKYNVTCNSIRKWIKKYKN